MRSKVSGLTAILFVANDLPGISSPRKGIVRGLTTVVKGLTILVVKDEGKGGVMRAVITARFHMPSVCNPEDLEDTGLSFEQMVKHLISEEGLFGVVDDDWEILSVEEEA